MATCACCGFTADGLRYGNIESGAKYCSEECLRTDPGWDDEDRWTAGV